MSKNGGHLTVQYNLRWTEELRDRIAEEAKKNTRSMNQEVIARLEDSFKPKTQSEYKDFSKNIKNYPLALLLTATIDMAQEQGFRVVLEPLEKN
ncbi:TPA: Arc family DNA-binding protein [Acinetobacter baumannii]|uniref:Arc family DNA-binding protein n=1 Tax=Acinetobacter baumannii TaxID=470 RepID=UPI000409143E|nr:Arc family DNA-binding protein [Acinetobacter baumannii]RSP29295.1 Arc family DNA-binding protein [Acinetobacter baumannii]HBN5965373.1 Arc family DNA-binding protein [Acinetobacter baumannii]HCA5024645.1 Arc family DNA-binding protein [Acinetobacter baumannii]